VGFFSRTAQTAAATIKAMTEVDMSKRFCSSNITILYPTDLFSSWPPEYLSVMDRFIRQLEDFLHTKRSLIDIGSKFKVDRVAGEDSMQEYLQNVCCLSAGIGTHANLTCPF